MSLGISFQTFRGAAAARYTTTDQTPINNHDFDSMLKRKILWLRADDCSKHTQIIRRIAAILIAALLTFSIVGIFIVIKGEKIWDKLGAFQKIKSLPGLTEKEIKVSLQHLKTFKKMYPKLGNEALAKWINKYKIPLNQLSLSKEEMKKIGKHLDFVGLNDPDLSEKTIHDILSYCNNAKTISLANGNITRLKTFPQSLRSLDCRHCENLQSLTVNCPHLYKIVLPKNLKRMKLADCQKLTSTNFPELPKGLEQLFVQGSPNLLTLPRFPKALNLLHIHNCSGLSRIDNFPLSLNKLNLSYCGNLKKIADLPEETQDVVITCCPALEEIPPLPNSLTLFKISDCISLYCFPKLPHNLQRFDIHNCENVRELPSLPGRLNEFSCEGFQGNALPPFPSSLRKLHLNQLKKVTHLNKLNEGLKSLHCTWCPNLISYEAPPTSLEVFNLEGCESLTTLGISLAELKQLKILKFSSIPSLLTLPQLPDNLSELDISFCSKLKYISNDLPHCLRKLICKGSGIQRINKLPPNLLTLDLSQSYELEKIHSFPKLVSKLDLSECKSLKIVPEIPQELKTLSISGCLALKSIPDLPQSLRRFFCNSVQLATLPKLINTNLALLECKNALKLEKLPELPITVQNINICDCPLIEEIPPLPNNLISLRCNNCKNLKGFPSFPQNLIELHCSDCTNLTKLPKAFPNKIEILDIRNCPKLKFIPVLPHSLRELHCKGSDSVKPLYHTQQTGRLMIYN